MNKKINESYIGKGEPAKTDRQHTADKWSFRYKGGTQVFSNPEEEMWQLFLQLKNVRDSLRQVLPQTNFDKVTLGNKLRDLTRLLLDLEKLILARGRTAQDIQELKKRIGEFLTEAPIRPKKEGSKLSDTVLTFDQLAKLWWWFHISDWYLGDIPKFTPRIPRTPARDVKFDIIEDDFTNRISVAPHLEDAMVALGGYPGKFVYAIDFRADPNDNVKAVDLSKKLRKCNAELSYIDQKRGGKFPYLSKKWTFEGWLRNFLYTLSKDEKVTDRYLRDLENSQLNAPSDIPMPYRKIFKYCVPDADDTHEQWLTKPSTFIYIGERIGNGRVKLSTFAEEELFNLAEEYGVDISSIQGSDYITKHNVEPMKW